MVWTLWLATVEFELANTGSRSGAEVVQVYLHQNQPSLPRPEKELKAFRKVFLKPREKRTISIPIDRSAFAFFDPAKSGWVAEKGVFRILVGSSSRDVRLQGEFNLGKTSFDQ